jgi:hypothetical protein
MHDPKTPVHPTCFFCFEREATLQIKPPANDWPEPIPRDAKIVLCGHCSAGLSAEQKAAVIVDYANTLRLAHNRRVLTGRSRPN